MSVSHLLEDFGAFANGDPVEMTDVLLEEERLEAFEKGYQAGWEDSNKAQASEAGRASAEFTQALADISLTYEEAFQGLLKGVHPLIDQIVRMVLPVVAHTTLAPRLAEIITRQVAETGRQPVSIRVAPGQARDLQAVETPSGQIAVSVTEDPMMSTDRVQLRFGDHIEQEIDLQDTIAQITEAIDSHFNTGQTGEQRKTA